MCVRASLLSFISNIDPLWPLYFDAFAASAHPFNGMTCLAYTFAAAKMLLEKAKSLLTFHFVSARNL